LDAAQRRVHFLHHPVTALFILFCGLAATISAWSYSNHALETRTQERFESLTTEFQHAIYERMILYEQVLWGGVALFNASDDVSRDEWRRYVDTLSIKQRWPGIQGIGFSIPLRPDEVDSTVAEIHEEGFPEFSVRPEGKRDEYSTIIYLEPFDWRNQRAFGYDMWSNEMRREAMTLARDTGNASTSGIITLVQETEDDLQRGFLTYLPVYQRGFSTGTLSERQAAFIGWVYAPFRMGDLMAGTLGVDSKLVAYEIYDGITLNDETLLYDSDDIRDGDAVGADVLLKQTTMEIQGRSWTIIFRANVDFTSSAEKAQPLVVAAIGITIDLLLFYVLTALMTLNRRATDIARERTIELELKNERLEESAEHNQRLLEIINRSTDFISYADPTGKILFSNEALLSVMGTPPKRTLIIQDLHPDPINELILTEGIPTAQRDGVWRGETILQTHDGQQFPVDHLILLHRDASGTIINSSTVMRDMSQQKSMEAALRSSNEELLRFAFVASHDLQEPLRKIISFSELLKQDLDGTLSEQSELYLSFLMDSARRMRQLIRDLLTYSRISQQDIPFVTCPAKSSLTVALSNLEGAQEAVSSDTLPNVVFTENHLVQLFQNLVSNGLKYQPKGQTPEVQISAQRTDDGWLFTVVDNGIGIEPRYHKQIFEPFKRLHNRTTYSGTGVGLAICKRIVERRGGTLWVESDPTKEGAPSGCAFFFTIPDALP